MITRRQFLRRGALWVPSLAIARATLAQEQYLQNRRKAFRSQWTPLSISGCFLWLDSTKITGKSDGEEIVTWTDSSGSGNDAGQVAATKKPLYKTGIQNSLPVVRFDTSNDFMTTPSIDLSGTQAVTLFLACNIAGSTAAYRRVIELSELYSTYTDAWVVYKINTTGLLYADMKGNVGTTTVHSSADVTGAFNQYTVRFDKALASDEINIRINGALDGSGSAINNTNSFGTYPIYLNSRGGTTNFGGLDVGEAILYNSDVSAGNVTTIEAYLKTKWATP